MIYSEAGHFLMFWSSDHGERNNGFLTSGRMVQGELHLPTPKENHDRAKAWLERMEAEKNGQKTEIGRDHQNT